MIEATAPAQSPPEREPIPTTGGQHARRINDGLVLGAIVAAAAALRFWHIGSQSYWFDEVATLDVIKGTFLHVFKAVHDNESTPPLYYLLAWFWRHIFGVSEAGIRSLSALAGIAAVPFVYLAGRELRKPAAGLFAAGLVAVNPMLIWYSQEARAYSLVVLLAAISLWLTLRARRLQTRSAVLWWSGSAVLALLTHYFAAFLILCEAAVLAWSLRKQARLVVAALLPVAVTGAALIPLAYAQEKDGRTSWIGGSKLSGRLGDVIHELFTANSGLISSNSNTPHGPWGSIALAAVIVSIVAGAAFALRGRRREAFLPLAVGAGAIAVPLVLVAVNLDYFKDRNLIAAWVPLALALGIALASVRYRVIAGVATAAIVAAGLAVTIQVGDDLPLQRTAWRQALATIPPATNARAVIVKPYYDKAVLDVYGLHLIPMPAGAQVDEIDLIGPEAPPAANRLPLPAGFRAIERRQVQSVAIDRFQPPQPIRYTDALLRQSTDPIYLQVSLAGRRWVDAYSRLLAQIQRDVTAAARGDAAAAQRLTQTPSGIAVLSSPPPELPTAPQLLLLMRTATAAASDYGHHPRDVQARNTVVRAIEHAGGTAPTF